MISSSIKSAPLTLHDDDDGVHSSVTTTESKPITTTTLNSTTPSLSPVTSTTLDSTTLPPSTLPTIPIETIPVSVPHDPFGVLDLSTTSTSIQLKKLFAVPAIVVARQIELMNLFIGFEEANKYQLLSPEGEILGYLMEEDLGFKSMIGRQVLKTHRAFKATVLSLDGEVLLIIRRPFSWINSRIYVSIPSTSSSPSSSNAEDNEIIIGEAQQEWHLYRRKYNHFLNRDHTMEQFASTDSGFLAWDFNVQNEQGEVIGSVNRNFAGFGRELFTDTGQYVLRFEGVIQEQEQEQLSSLPPPPSSSSSSSSSLLPSTSSTTSTTPNPTPINPEPEVVSTSKALTLPPIPSITYDQRAVLLASAISIDFDYFTRSRGGLVGGGGMGSGLWMPMPMGGLGGGAGAGAGEGAEGGGGGLMQGEQEEGGGPMPSSDSGYGASGNGDNGNDAGEWSGSNGNENNWSNDEVMRDDAPMVDPWASTEQSGGTSGGGGDEGTWSWGDLFPDE